MAYRSAAASPIPFSVELRTWHCAPQTPQALSWPTGQQPGAAGSPDPADHELSGSDWVLEEELGRLRIVELRRRAVAAKVDPAELESARDDDDPKGAMVTLLLRSVPSLSCSAATANPLWL